MRPQDEILSSSPLAGHQDRLNKAAISLDYYELRGSRHLRPRPNESSSTFAGKPKISIPITKATIDSLTKHLYNPGPLRQHPNQAAHQWLDMVYALCHANLLFAKADAWSLLHGVSAIGVTATPSVGLGTLRLDVFGAHELVVWCSPDDPGRPEAVCVIGYDYTSKRRRYTLWTTEAQTVYEGIEGTKPALMGEIANPYGVIPFTFYHSSGPVVRDFWEGGHGEYLAELNGQIDLAFADSLQGMANSVPILWGTNCDPSIQITASPGVLNLLSSGGGMNAPAQLGYTQSPYDARVATSAAFGIAESAIELLGVPPSAFRASASQATSGIALLLEQVPLLTQAKKRQQYTDIFESELASMIMLAMGNFYQMPWLAAANQQKISTSWPAFMLPVPFPDQDQADQQLIDWGLLSQIDLACRRFNISREQAIQRILQVREDQRLVASLSEPTTVPPVSPNPELSPPDDGINPPLADPINNGDQEL